MIATLTTTAPGTAGPAPGSTPLWRRLQADTWTRQYRYGTRRVVPAAVTLRRIRPLMPLAGITRLASVTGLDWLGIPVYQAVRPTSRNLSVSQGKGLTRAHAMVSALMESLESFHAEEIRQPRVRATVGEMKRELQYDPYALALRDAGALHDATVLDWIAATDLGDGSPTWVPRLLCQLDYRVGERLFVPLFWTSSNGLASGNTVGEALVHGLCEIVERDALARQRDPARPWRIVDPASVDAALARRLLDRIARAGLRTRIADVSGPTGLPTFEVWIEDPGDGPVYFGAGCHRNRLIALTRALTEAAQSRAAVVAGSRDDLPRTLYGRRAKGAQDPADDSWVARFRDAPSLPSLPPTQEVADLVRRVQGVTGMPALGVDLIRPEFDVPVVFAVAPGLQRWTP
jgi:ribosomal protein S12 methylthiotransferase accessory factor